MSIIRKKYFSECGLEFCGGPGRPNSLTLINAAVAIWCRRTTFSTGAAYCRAGEREVRRNKSRGTRQISKQLCSVIAVRMCSTSSQTVSNGRLPVHVSRQPSPASFVGLYSVQPCLQHAV